MSEAGESETDDAESERDRRVVHIVALLGVLLITAGVAFGLGLLPVGGDGDRTGTATPTPVPALSSVQSEAGTDTSGSAPEDTPETEASPNGTTAATPTTAAGVTVQGDTRQFRFEVLGLESCGQTCRDANVELTNSGEAATDVAATSRLYAGDADGDKVWQGTETVGDMAADETVRRTTRIELSYVEASKVCGADTVTLVTDVASTDHRQQFTSHPDIGC